MNNDKLLRKIKKLLSLANSTNPHEAAKALEMAQKLMKEHHITQTDVELSVMSEHETDVLFADKPPRYIHILSNIIDRAFGVRCYFNSRRDKNWRFKRSIMFYGADERPVIAAYCFDVLLRQLLKARKEFNATQNKRLKRKTAIARADSFCEGWCRGVSRVVSNFALTDKETESLEQYDKLLNEKHNFSTDSGRSAGNTKDYGQAAYAGFKQGQQVRLNHGINGQETEKLGHFS
ncbi:DUF2786 domain-containing protein [Testudinibacter sp. TR-2022]|uniref:DUF2786 domain-containing protein n=1 Tax=Testudinibacter sp. TR-2022 TaxID=2585029 RepID=UPI00111A3532|nr:DUF2786 domain-containing protein [Testudinibacter sp. TR-2022]TNH04491.1 DUF2786 domain-containing protein [Pasteurellaceae bacterium Phil31]TNH11987.1 DUF2786 domain-containing protein [Testudinibacter sp. TR-2022]TNH12708.1 DUF2786 domain-containing protein [Testudinibacter sp. TR-2022]TNH13699.1 DUF2786 domain-containing protein [Testudinibacter sp. TR-2022]TNH17219.1 DUF2786 domain-containing protein [Testudinibacter sp. TR-2022]